MNHDYSFGRTCPTVCVSRLGWERGLAAETEKTQSLEKAQNDAARTPSRLHAVLGAGMNHVHFLYSVSNME